MKDMFYDLRPENYSYLVNWYLEDGSTWQQAASEQWRKLSDQYDFSEPSHEPHETDVSDALEIEDFMLATKLALHCSQIEPLEFALEQKSAELLYGLISYFSMHGYYEDNSNIWDYINSSNLLAKAVRYHAEQCFILLLTFEQINPIQDDTDSDVVYHSLDWLLRPEYKDVAGWFQANKQTTTYSHYCGEVVKMDLFAAFALERKFTLASHLIHKGWKTINPFIGDFDDQLLDAAIYQARDGKSDLLEWYLSLVGTQVRYSQEVLEDIDTKKSDIKDLVTNFDELVDLGLLEQSVCTTMANNYSPYIQLECLDNLSALHHYPVRNGDYQPKPKSISLFNDIKRIHENLLKPYVTDFKVCLVNNKLLSVSLFEHGEEKPTSRATINCSHLPSFTRIFSACEYEGTHPTDFQIQLAILSMHERELIANILSRLEPVI